ncbi:bifunctional glutamate--cysteine ligase GshA/glutathione synthetase GshB [Vallitalea okinawensis]|uniref:bifunctional glutamate--cysteine ligase GshA/glutathione synthetase GshB n=1 Tax=Vallitalea okinawensis TaxID=2078660 RepID=UPI000CFB8095|nr:bifunctional glutamate--cysteine ligase GshA/glutathione synthetase GshB [Vallitalea okinawensis]
MLNKLFNKENSRLLLEGNFGMEKEHLRVQKNGEIASSNHPEAFGNKLANPYITTDFSESQLEMITPVCKSINDVHQMLENIHDIVSSNIDDELLWPGSLPPEILDEDSIKIAMYDRSKEGKGQEAYRQFLVDKYGKKKQLLCGIHYNYSLSDRAIEWMFKEIGFNEGNLQTFKNQLYLKIARNFMKNRWLLVYLMGASPTGTASFVDKSYPHAISLRNSQYGYCNKDEILLSYNNLEEYAEDFREYISKGTLQYEKELYSPIRLKSHPFNIDGLLENGINYLEMRLLDVNPLDKVGITIDDLRFIHLFMLYNLMLDESSLSKAEQLHANDNVNRVALYGRQDGLTLNDINGQEKELVVHANELLANIRTMVDKLTDDVEWHNALKIQMNKLNNKELLPSSQIASYVEEKDFKRFNLERAAEYAQETKQKSYRLKGYEDLELSTQILLRGAIKNGVEFEVLDRQDNFIALKKNQRLEYVKQATKTSLDSYSTFLIMENKLVSKIVLEKAGVKVPAGAIYTSGDEALVDYKYYRNKKIVVKPKSTNFGIGITIIKGLKDYETYEKAVKMAFSHDRSVLVEEFIKGKEYRFLVMGDETIGILHRVPANVTGNDHHTIRELVKAKNEDPLRGKGYRTPLEKIKCGEAEELFLELQGLTFDYIPKKDEVVYLRENSNISTGGDSIDFTDDIIQPYKDIAVKAAKAAGATICGVDIMIDDIMATPNENNHAIIEINFNPAIHIHGFPYKGVNRKAEEKILDLLF